MNIRCTRWCLLIGFVITFGVSSTRAQKSKVEPPRSQPAASKKTGEKNKRRSRKTSPEQAARRAKALRAIAKSLDVGAGGTIADIGAGTGRDSAVFAQIVGKSGTVYSEEILAKDVSAIRQMAKQRGLSQIKPVLGKVDSPSLPPDSVDMAYMHYVYHHFTKPREMLRGLWQALKPNGYLVIVDRHLGTLRDWVPRARRGAKHFWIAETTVVREAREEGFEFVRCAEDCWPADDQFVLMFRRPAKMPAPGTDPDPMQSLDIAQATRALIPTGGTRYQHPVFIALGQARQLIAPIMQHTAGSGLDVILEEWATRKDERPPLPKGISLPSTLTENGDPHFGNQPVDAVFFLDTYDLLFHGETLLAKIHDALTADGRVFILDRKANRRLSRRLASHHRMISPDMVKQEMRRAGFELARTAPAPAADRFLLVFRKAAE